MGESMTNVTREELEACARLLGHNPVEWWSAFVIKTVVNQNPFALARAAKLIVNYEQQYCCVPDFIACFGGLSKIRWNWPEDGTEAECICKATAAAQLEKEKQ